MKKGIIYVLLPVILSMAVICSYAQNLVPNPSFEIFITCPNTFGQIGLAIPWFQSNTIASSSDYYNSCNAGNFGSRREAFLHVRGKDYGSS